MITNQGGLPLKQALLCPTAKTRKMIVSGSADWGTNNAIGGSSHVENSVSPCERHSGQSALPNTAQQQPP